MNFLLDKFVEYLNFKGYPSEIGFVIFSILPFSLIFGALMLSVIILVFIERKLLAFFQQRIGPNIVGFHGILQTTADAIKLLCKENIDLIFTDKFLFTLAPVMAFVSIVLLWCIIPYNADFKIINSPYSLLIYLVISLFPVLFHFLGGYVSNNKYSIIAAYRIFALNVSYAVPLIFSILSIVCLTNSLNLAQIIESQTTIWNIFLNFIGFVIFYISTLAELNRTPFDLAEAESELVCGYHTEYSGMRFAMFFLGEYAALFVSSALISILFLGGYLPPFNIYLSNIFLGNCEISNYIIYFEQTLWLIIKTSAVIFSIILIRATFPRLTQKFIFKLFWKYLIPVSIINLMLILILKKELYSGF